MSVARKVNGKRSKVRAKAPLVTRAIPLIDARLNGKEIRPPFDMPVIRAPKFPNRLVDIRDHGAVADGTTDCGAAIARAIDACAQAGGGRVLVPPGKWLTGPIHLKSNIDLHVADGAVVSFQTDPERYLPAVFVRWQGQECYNYSPLIYARDCDNIAITGRGVLLGQGKSWWSWEKRQQKSCNRLYQMVLKGDPVEDRQFASEDHPLRPQFILPINCTNVLMEDFTIGEGGPFWTIHLAYCDNVIIRRLQIHAPDGPNNDGIVVDSSRNLIIEDCDIQSSEDCIALKSGMNEDGQRVGKATENIIIRNIRATAGHGGITIGSEMSGGVRNVFVHDCQYDGPSAGIRLKAARGRGGVVEDVFIQDITMGKIPGDAIQLTTEYPSFVSPNGKAPTFRNIRLRDITCQHAQTAVRMVGLPDSALRDITLENVTINADEGLQCSSGNGIRLVNVTIKPRNGPVLSVKDSQEVLIDGLNNCEQTSVFLDLRGRQTRNIRLRGEASNHVRPAIVLGVDVPKDALVHE